MEQDDVRKVLDRTVEFLDQELEQTGEDGDPIQYVYGVVCWDPKEGLMWHSTNHRTMCGDMFHRQAVLLGACGPVEEIVERMEGSK